MENGAKYVVETRWGVFSLDEAAYRDYLAGKLWISWNPGVPESKPADAGDTPPDVSDRAITLRNQAAQVGFWSVLEELRLSDPPVPYSPRLNDISIDELTLSTRSINGLKRAGIMTFRALHSLLVSEGGIMSIRNLGQKSAKEIQRQFYEECYQRLLPYEKAKYWQTALDEKQNGS